MTHWLLLFSKVEKWCLIPFSADSEPDERIYWVLVSIPILFFLIGVLILCWNQCGLLKPYYFYCCALCKKMEKEDLNTDYGMDLDDASYVMEVVYVKVFIFWQLTRFQMYNNL